MEAGPRDTSYEARHGGAEPLDRDFPDDVVEDRDDPEGAVGPAVGDDADERALGSASYPDYDRDGPQDPSGSGESFRDLRPPRRLRVWQLVPIVGVAIIGSLMFAFPLAFEFGDGGTMVAMLGLLLGCCAAGWGLMAARRVGLVWPGLPPRGSGRRPDWRCVLVYVAVVALLAGLAIWRVSRLR